MNGRLNILTGIHVTLVQSVSVVQSKEWTIMGRRKGWKKVKGRLLNMFSNVALGKKDLSFDTWLLLDPQQVYEDMLNACPSVQKCKEKGWNPESLFTFYLR